MSAAEKKMAAKATDKDTPPASLEAFWGNRLAVPVVGNWRFSESSDDSLSLNVLIRSKTSVREDNVCGVLQKAQPYQR
jgi:hypothetical protein